MKPLSLLALLFSLTYSLNSLPATEQPNIILLLADDLGYGELGCQGNPQIPTPHIDSLANEGIRFTQAYVTAPNCSPSRAGLLTGRIPTRFGYEFNPIGARNEDPGTGLPPEEQTIAELLHDQGYTTGLIGKWHLGGAADYHPYRHGFDEFFGFMHEGHYFVPPPYQGVTTMLRRKSLPGGERGRWLSKNLVYSTHMGYNEPDYDANNPIIRGGQPVNETEYLTDAFTREAISFIDRHQDKPFFLYLAYNAVHSPLQGKKENIQNFTNIEDIHRRIFAAMLSSMDQSVGKILKRVHQSGLDKKTLIIFLSDNGGPTRELTSSNLPLRGEKGSMYEGGLRVPFMIRWTGTLAPKQIIEAPVSSLDIFPTSAALAGAPLPQNRDGRNLLPFLLKQKMELPNSEFFWRQGRRAALRSGAWKIVQMRGTRDKPVWELYHLANDLAETQDLAKTNSEKLIELQTRWNELNSQMKPPLF
ncbi:sulfatase [Gimesia algae]|uniref:Arylsulfatase n=1 Tax=Gimesia algae TaxID=2527971 RepID=A0A517VHA7_9PLAN|nr:sulfatase [Gimesia algae]QDT92398.1 Arylsulfatase [Gimesia algae]